MTNIEFNEKWKDYIPDRQQGMEFEDEEIVNICDDYFNEIIKLFPGLEIYQIKEKFGTARVYTNMQIFEERTLEKIINTILEMKK